MPKDGNRTYKKGGQYRNQNAAKHSVYSNFPMGDARTKESKFLNEKERELERAFGNRSPNEAEKMLIRRIAVKDLRLRKAEQILCDQNGNVSQSLVRDYLKWSASLRADLIALGLNERQFEKTLPSLTQQTVFLIPVPSKEVPQTNYGAIIPQKEAIPLPSPSPDSENSELKPLEMRSETAKPETEKKIRNYSYADDYGLIRDASIETSPYAEQTRRDYAERLRRARKRGSE